MWVPDKEQIMFYSWRTAKGPIVEEGLLANVPDPKCGTLECTERQRQRQRDKASVKRTAREGQHEGRGSVRDSMRRTA